MQRIKQSPFLLDNENLYGIDKLSCTPVHDRSSTKYSAEWIK